MHNALQCSGDSPTTGAPLSWLERCHGGGHEGGEGVLTAGGSCTPCVHTPRKCCDHRTTTAELVVSEMLHMYVVSGNSSGSFAF